MNANKLRSLVFVALCPFMLSGCIDGVIGTSDNPGDSPKSGYSVEGAAEKGPFVIGSTVTVSTLTPDGTPTSETIVTQTTNDIGDFQFHTTEKKPVRVSVQGYHFNEITGRLSNSILTLHAIYDIGNDDQQIAHVNILTHIIYNRVLRKMSEGVSATAAIVLSQNELVASLKPVLDADSLSNFTDLSLYNINEDPVGNSYLLALSSIAYQYAISKSKLNDSSVDAELTFLLNDLSSSFGNSGTISDLALINDLTTASRLLRPNEIRENLILRSYLALGDVLEVADMNQFIDTDADGQTNIVDNDDDNDGILDIEDPEPYGVNKAEIQVATPQQNSSLSGVVTIEGTANEFTQLVRVKVGNNAFIEANGTTHWSLELDTTNYTDGSTELIVEALQTDWGTTEIRVPVTIENVDPLVGTWQCKQRDYGNTGNAYFLANGGFAVQTIYMFEGYVTTWERVDDTHIVVRGAFTSNVPRLAQVTNDTLVINDGYRYFDCIRQ